MKSGIKTRRRKKTAEGYREVAPDKALQAYHSAVNASLLAAEENFKIRFVHRRKELRRSQKELAAAVGVSVNTIQAYEDGNLPRGGNLVQVAYALGCSVDWLIGMEGNGICVNPDLLPPLDNSPAYLNSNPGGFIRVKHFEIPGYEPVGFDALTFSIDWLKEMAHNPDNVRLIYSPPHGKADSMMLVDLGVQGVFQACNYLVKLNEHYAIHRVSVRPGNIYLLHSDDDPLANPYEVPAKEVTIIGRIIWASKMM